MRPLRPLVSASALAASVFTLASTAVGQTAPDDEPLPPAMGRPTAPPPRPTTTPPPPAAAPAPAATTSPPSPPPAPVRPEPSRTEASPSRSTSSTAASLEATASPPTVPGLAATPKGDPDSYLPTLTGPIGLYHVSTAEVGPAGHLRLGLHGQYFRASGFLVEGANGSQDTNTRFSGNFTFGYTPHEALELYGGIFSSSNRNERVSEPGRRDPELIKAFGDLVLGGKAVAPIARGFSAGAELGFRFLSGISDLSVSPSSTSLWTGGVATLDLRPIARTPLRFHANLNYYLDNS